LSKKALISGCVGSLVIIVILRIPRYLKNVVFSFLFKANLAKRIQFRKSVIHYRIVFMVLYLHESVVELALFNAIRICFKLLRISPRFRYVKNICYSIGANVTFKITVFALVFLIVDVMSSS
jgi:hypothetical protein